MAQPHGTQRSRPLSSAPNRLRTGGAERSGRCAAAVLDPLPDGRHRRWRLLAGVDFVLVADLADVGDVGQQLVQAGLGERLAAALAGPCASSSAC